MENNGGNRKWQPLEDRQIEYLDQHLLLAVQLLIESGTGKNSLLETCSWLTGKKIHLLLLNSSLGRACQETNVHWDPVGWVEWDQSLTARTGCQGPGVGGGELLVVEAPREEDVRTACAIPEPSSSWSHAEPEQGALHSIS